MRRQEGGCEERREEGGVCGERREECEERRGGKGVRREEKVYVREGV